MRIDILTLFPESFSYVNCSMVKKAQEKGLVSFHLHNIRDFTCDKHHITDDLPYGGGRGMVLKPEPVFACVRDIQKRSASAGHIILLTPSGCALTQAKAQHLAALEHLILICGHYEGVDERIATGLAHEELSIGDFILTGGELAAMVVADSVIRMLPGVLDAEVTGSESFVRGMLDYPQYTRPVNFEGMQVPEVLTSGNHREIEKWRTKEIFKRTYLRRPDLWSKISLTKEEQKLFNEALGENQK